ncbi:hypothetical protein ABK040_005695 [Willaertia magna]
MGDSREKISIPRLSPFNLKELNALFQLLISSYCTTVFFGDSEINSKNQMNYYYYYKQNIAKEATLSNIAIECIHQTLIVGHTYIECDQTIGTDKVFLYKKSLYTLPQIIYLLNKRKNTLTISSSLEIVGNWKNNLLQYYKRLNGITKYKFFKIEKDGIVKCENTWCTNQTYEFQTSILNTTLEQIKHLTFIGCWPNVINEIVAGCIEKLLNYMIDVDYKDWWKELLNKYNENENLYNSTQDGVFINDEVIVEGTLDDIIN